MEMYDEQLFKLANSYKHPLFIVFKLLSLDQDYSLTYALQSLK
jgi:hypothetical protein